VKHRSYKAPHYAVFSSFPPLVPPQVHSQNTSNPQSTFFPYCERPIFTPMQKTGKIMLLYVLLFKLFDRRHEQKRL